jgi:ferredoxin
MFRLPKGQSARCLEDFSIRRLGDFTSVVDIGCGLCASTCPADALRLERRPAGERMPVPANPGEWSAERARQRGLTNQV